MCRFFSAVVAYKNKKLYWDMDLDHHSDILEKYKIKDNDLKPKFVKVEYVPIDRDEFNHDLNNWVLQVDQDFIPDWYDEKVALSMCKKALLDVFKNRFLINANISTIKTGRWYVKNTNIESVRGGVIKYVRGGTIESVDGGTIESVAGGVIKSVYGGVIESVYGGVIKSVRGGVIKYVYGGVIKSVDGGTIESVYGGEIESQAGGVIFYGYKISVCDKNYEIEYVGAK